jgi:Xaa-Pro aminopeptidase
MKAIKNPVEIEGVKQCHLRDAAAKVCFYDSLY